MHEGQWRGRPASILSLLTLDVLGGAMALFGALAPLTPDSPARLNGIGAAIAIAFAAALWHLGPRTPKTLIHLNVVVYVGATTALVASAATGAGAMSIAFCYLLVTMYVAAFMSRPVTRAYVTASITLLAVGLIRNDAVLMGLTIWLTPALACVGAGEVLSWLTMHLRSLSLTDPLTGLSNRAGFRQAALREIAAADRDMTPVTFVVVDLNDFKRVNDDHGHAAGDRLLADLAREWVDGLRPRDVVGRLGGDEFVFLLPDTDEHAAGRLVERLQAASRGSWSFGIAARHVGEDLDESLERADRRLCEAKLQHGRQVNT